MKPFFLLIIAFCNWLDKSFAQRQVRPQIYALVIGVAEYNDPHIPNLKYADKDAVAFSNFLKTPNAGALSGGNLVVLRNKEATLRNIMRELDKLLGESTKEDLFIFYFSGHAIDSRKDNMGYLLCYDAEKDNEAGSALSMNVLSNRINHCDAKMKLSYVDACHAGKFKGDGKGMASNYDITDDFRKSISGSWEGYAAFLSSTAQQESIESDTLQAGTFTYYLVKGLSGAADSLEKQIRGYEDGKVTITELENYLSVKVRQATGFTQKPTLQGEMYDDDFPLSIITSNTSLGDEIKKRPTLKSHIEAIPHSLSPFKVIRDTLTVLRETVFPTAIQAGDSIVIKASGQVYLGMVAGVCGPAGVSIDIFRIYSYFSNMPHGALLVKVGDGSFSTCNVFKTGVASRAGKLTFLINDKDYENNTGGFKVYIEIFKRRE